MSKTLVAVYLILTFNAHISLGLFYDKWGNFSFWEIIKLELNLIKSKGYSEKPPECLSLSKEGTTHLSQYSYGSVNKCVNLYKEDNCQGEYTSVPHSLMIFYPRYRFGQSYMSVGPCHEPCDLYAGQPNKSTLITVYGYPNFTGRDDHLEILGCTPIPKGLRDRINSFRTYESENVCLEFYKNWDCRGEFVGIATEPEGSEESDLTQRTPRSGYSVRIQTGTPGFHNSEGWKVFDGMQGISHCGFNCIEKPKLEEFEQNPENNTQVVLYEQTDYNGYYLILNISSDCLNLPKDWEGETMSIKTFEECVTIFELPNCNTDEKYLELNDTNDGIQMNLTKGGFDLLIRSITLCQDNYDFTFSLNETFDFSSNDSIDNLTAAEPVTSEEPNTHPIILGVFSGLILTSLVILTAFGICLNRKKEDELDESDPPEGSVILLQVIRTPESRSDNPAEESEKLL